MAKLTFTGVKPTDLERRGEEDTIVTAKLTSIPWQHCSVKVSLGFIHFVIGRVDCLVACRVFKPDHCYENR